MASRERLWARLAAKPRLQSQRRLLDQIVRDARYGKGQRRAHGKFPRFVLRVIEDHEDREMPEIQAVRDRADPHEEGILEQRSEKALRPNGVVEQCGGKNCHCEELPATRLATHGLSDQRKNGQPGERRRAEQRAKDGGVKARIGTRDTGSAQSERKRTSDQEAVGARVEAV